jgi:hypothetical protein
MCSTVRMSQTRSLLGLLVVLLALPAGGCAADANGETSTEDPATEHDDETDAVGQAASTPAPSCVVIASRSPIGRSTIRADVVVRNDCHGTQRVSLDLVLAFDPPCVSLRPGARTTFSYNPQATSIRHVKRC